MWVRGKPPTGVVSHPSDDRRFDVFGERAVGTAVIVIAPDVIVAGMDEATITRSAAGADARWELPIYFSGLYNVFVRPAAAPRAGERLEIAIDKTPAAPIVLDPTRRDRNWVEVGSTAVTVREGLVPGPVWVAIVIRSASTGAIVPTSVMSVDAVRLVQQQ